MKQLENVCLGSVIFCTVLLVVALPVSAGEQNMTWLKDKCPNGALAWDHGGAKLLEVNSGVTKTLGSGKFLEFSTEGSFVGWNDGGKAMVYARKSGTTKQFKTGITGHVSWVSDHEFVVYAGSWKKIDVLTGSESTPANLSTVMSSAVDEEDDLKMTEGGYWVVLDGSSIKSNAPDKLSVSRPGECSGSLSKNGYSVGGLEHTHAKYTFIACRSSGSSGSVSWSINCSGKGMDNNRFSSTSKDWIVDMNECASSMAAHYIPTNDYVLLGSSAKTSGENYGDFSHCGPALDFGTTIVRRNATHATYNAAQTVAVYRLDGTRVSSGSAGGSQQHGCFIAVQERAGERPARTVRIR